MRDKVKVHRDKQSLNLNVKEADVYCILCAFWSLILCTFSFGFFFKNLSLLLMLQTSHYNQECPQDELNGGI